MKSSLNFEGAWSIDGKAQRKEWVSQHQKLVPAPGQHTLNFSNKPSSQEYKFPQGQREPLEDTRGFPGPGQYDIKEGPDSKIKIEMGYKIKMKNDNTNPSPAVYYPKQQQVKKNLPSFSMSYKHPKEIISFTPGPAAYPNEEFEEFKMSRTQQSWARKTQMSGFGTSQQRSTTNPSRRLDVLRNIPNKKDNPGPGEYIGHDKYKLEKGISIGKSERNTFMGDGLPGPNHFTPKQVLAKSTGFSIGLKLNNGMKTYQTDSPGPGRYQPQPVKTRQNIKIGGQGHNGLIDNKNINNPGPDHYDQQLLPKQVSHLQSLSIGLAERPDLNEAAKENTPGPAQYFPKKEQKVKGPSYVMGSKLKEQKKFSSMTPGPAQYNPFFQSNSIAIGSTTGQRSDPVKSKFTNVGPNSYNVSASSKFGYRYSMGNSTRFGKQKKNYEPGPGSYDVGGTIGKIPEYLMLSKKKNQGLLDFS